MSTHSTSDPERSRIDHSSPSTPPPQTPAEPRDLVVSVDGDEVLVHGTTRDDADVIQALKTNGFRWFRSLQSWGLPRSFRPETRIARVEAFVKAMARLDRTVTVDDSDRDLDAAERRQAREERLTERADRLAQRASRNAADADASRARADRIYSGYNGQPILVGHHSERRHRRDLDRADAAMRSSFDAAAVAADQQRRADQIRRHLERGDHPVTIKLRLQRTEAELRKLQRSLRAARAAGREPSRTMVTAATSRAQDIDLDRAALEELAARGVTRDWGPDDFQPGDLVEFHCLGWYEVRKVNRTTLTVPSHVGGSWTDTVTYAKVVARSRSGTRVTAADLLRQVSPPTSSTASDEPSTP